MNLMNGCCFVKLFPIKILFFSISEYVTFTLVKFLFIKRLHYTCESNVYNTIIIWKINHKDDITTWIFTGRVDGKDSLLIIVRNAPTAATTNINTYVPLFDTPPVDDTTKKLIEETCGDNSECAYDIAVTGNVDVGKETLNDIEEHMIIVNLTLPSMYEYILCMYVCIFIIS